MIISTCFFSSQPSLNIETFVHFLLQHYINGYFTIMYYLWFRVRFTFKFNHIFKYKLNKINKIQLNYHCAIIALSVSVQTEVCPCFTGLK